MRLRRVARIAQWEVSRSASGIDKRIVALGMLAVLLAGGVTAVSVAGGIGEQPALDRDLYRVAVPEDSPYQKPVAASPSLDSVRPGAPADLRVLDANTTDRTARIRPADSTKGEAALAAFRSAVRRYNTRLMRAETNRTAAFPVSVQLRYVSRDSVSATDAQQSSSDTTVTPAKGNGDTSGRDSGRTEGGGLSVPELGGGGTSSVLSGSSEGSPAEISPPFPFASLVLAFVFLLPMNFVIQAYGSSILEERVNRRGELLLVAPVSPGEIVVGKTLPYALAALGITVAITVGIAATVGGAGPTSVAAVFPIALLFLATAFVGGMFARSFKELTFVTVAASVFLTSYAFVPAIFATVTPVALISPLTIVVRDLQGTATSLLEYLFSTGPFYFAAAGLFLLGTGVYREEDMFTQRPVPLKFLDALAVRLTRPGSVAAMSGLFIPFVFIAELLAIAFLFALPISVSIPLLLVTIAGVEEVAKSIHVYAGFHNDRFEPEIRMAAALGILSGLGFFIGEKLFVVVQVVGLPTLAIGQAAFTSAGVGVGPAGTAVALIAPLALHVVTATITSLGATRGQWWYLGGLAVATVTHALYNLVVVIAFA